jgi:hypothetical protein
MYLYIRGIDFAFSTILIFDFEIHNNPCTVVSVSRHYSNPIEDVGLAQSGHNYHLMLNDIAEKWIICRWGFLCWKEIVLLFILMQPNSRVC